MGTISRVLYQPTNIDPYDAGEYYFHQNVIGIDPVFHKEYEKYETRFAKTRANIVKEALQNLRDTKVDFQSVVLGGSVNKNKIVLLADIR